MFLIKLRTVAATVITLAALAAGAHSCCQKRRLVDRRPIWTRSGPNRGRNAAGDPGQRDVIPRNRPSAPESHLD